MNKICKPALILSVALISLGYANNSSGDVVQLLEKIEKKCKSVRTVDNAKDVIPFINDASRRVTELAIADDENKTYLRDEVERIAKSDMSDVGINLYYSGLLDIYAKSCTMNEYIKFSEVVICSDLFSVDSKEILLRKLGYEFRNQNIFKDGAYELTDLTPLLTKASCLDNEIKRVALRMLLGWEKSKLEVAPVNVSEGMRILKREVEKNDTFVGKQPYLDWLAKFGYQRDIYLTMLRSQINNEEVPLWLRYKYAKLITEWDLVIVKEFEEIMSENSSRINSVVFPVKGSEYQAEIKGSEYQSKRK